MQTPVPQPPSALRIAAVVVTHNRLAQLQCTVPRLLAEPLDHVVVIDNGSSDGSAEWLAGLGDKRLDIITSAQNSGGAGGFEVGMRHTMARHNPDWLVLMDDDARPMPGMIADFRSQDHAGAEAVAAAVHYPDGRICEMNRPSVNPFWHPKKFIATLMGRGRMGFHVTDADYDLAGERAVDAASFVGLFLSRRGIDRAGFPDGQLFIYGDDVLYTLGLRRAGGQISFAPAIRFEHDCSTYDGDARVTRPLWKVYYLHRNSLFVYRAASGWLFPFVLLAVLPKWWMKSRAYGAADRPVFLRLLRRAVGDGLRGRRTRSHDEVMGLALQPK